MIGPKLEETSIMSTARPVSYLALHNYYSMNHTSSTLYRDTPMLALAYALLMGEAERQISNPDPRQGLGYGRCSLWSWRGKRMGRKR